MHYSVVHAHYFGNCAELSLIFADFAVPRIKSGRGVRRSAQRGRMRLRLASWAWGCRPGLLQSMLQRRPNELRKQRMRIEWLRLEFRVKLATQEPRMVGCLNDLHVILVGRPTGNFQSGRRQNLLVFAIEFVTVPVPLADLQLSVSLVCERSRLQLARP